MIVKLPSYADKESTKLSSLTVALRCFTKSALGQHYMLNETEKAESASSNPENLPAPSR